MAAAIDYTYQYPFASSVEPSKSGANLSLATFTRTNDSPYFFDGKMRDPRVLADMFLVLSDVVRTHFFLPRPPLMDPVLTSNDSMLRMEGFSGCCGVYVRVDMSRDAFDGDVMNRGTTNVDFNEPMRAALRRIKRQDDVRFAVGKTEVALAVGAKKVVEKKVKLPLRWIKGFSEVQAYQPQLEPVYDIPAPQALRLIRSFPAASQPKSPMYLTGRSTAVRLSHRKQSGAVKILGTHRPRVLEPLLVSADSLRVWFDQRSGTSGWEVISPTERLMLLVSPEIYRGFSGEGQNLEALAGGKWGDLLAAVRAQINWQNEVDAGAIAAAVGASADDVEATLAALGSRGLAGYDLNTGCYFHRELPFDRDKIDAMQPRLKGAMKLLENARVKIHERHDDGSCALVVGGTGVDHFVRIGDDGDRCTCPWYSKHPGQRGPCKHILAAQIFLDQDASDPA